VAEIIDKLYLALKASGQWDEVDETWEERFEGDFRVEREQPSAERRLGRRLDEESR